MATGTHQDPKSMFDPVLFWDADEIDMQKHAGWIIARILDFGGAADLKRLRELYPARMIIQTLKKRRGISRRTARFWAAYYRIPQEEIICLKKQHRRIRSR